MTVFSNTNTYNKYSDMPIDYTKNHIKNTLKGCFVVLNYFPLSRLKDSLILFSTPFSEGS